jgi:hypothetical protein
MGTLLRDARLLIPTVYRDLIMPVALLKRVEKFLEQAREAKDPDHVDAL